MGPGHYDTSSGIDATTSKSTTFLPLPREKCNYDSYIRASLGQTTGTTVGPGKYGWKPATNIAPGAVAFSNIVRYYVVFTRLSGAQYADVSRPMFPALTSTLVCCATSRFSFDVAARVYRIWSSPRSTMNECPLQLRGSSRWSCSFCSSMRFAPTTLPLHSQISPREKMWKATRTAQYLSSPSQPYIPRQEQNR